MSVDVDRDVPVEMRDGVVLRADVYRPAGRGRYPVLVRRTPYGKGRTAIGDPHRLAAHGYTVVIQDTRGRYTSAGDWSWMFGPHGAEVAARDGYDTVEWAATLPGGNGQVGTWGHSNDAWCSWQLAGLQPPHLAGMVASGMPARLLDWTRGILETGRRLEWAYLMAADAKRRAGEPAATYDAEQARHNWHAMERGKWLWYLPLERIPRRVFGPLTDQLHTYYRQIDQELFDFSQVHPKVTWPVLVFTGWWDRLVASVDNYRGLVAATPPPLRDRHRLIIGPWGHSPAALTRRLGPLDNGPSAATTHEDLVAGFFDRQLKGRDHPSGAEPEAPVRIFTLGVNQWRSEREWPPARARYSELFLHSGGHANGVRGDGELSWQPPGAQPPDTYVYDPRDPVMSLMEPNCQAAPRDQSPLDDRDDVLVYQTAPLQRPVEVTGPVTARLWAVTDAPDTDWTVKLVDVRPDGLAINVASGIIRARHRDGYTRPSLLTPGVAYAYEIRMTPVSIVFGAGHRIRLDVSSSDFPNFDRNHNTGADFWSDAELRPARQQLLHDREYPSHLVLPVIL